MRYRSMKKALVLLIVVAGCEYEGGLLGVIEPLPGCSPDALGFLGAEGGVVDAKTLTLKNDGDTRARFSLEEDANWLTLSAYSATSSGPDDEASVDVTPDLAGLSPGVYRATIWVRCEGWVKPVDVELVVATGGSDVVYVSMDGSDATGDGSFGNPYRTLTKGASELSPPGKDVLFVLPSETAYGAGETFPIEIVEGAAIEGPGPEHVEVSGGSSSRVFTVSTAPTADPSAVRVLSGLTVSDASGGPAEHGGAMEISNPVGPSPANNVEASDCVFESCTSQNNAGAVEIGAGCVVTFTGCVFRANSAGGGAGAVHDVAGATYRDCLFESNDANDEGGAVTCADGQFDGCTFVANSAGQDGGACFLTGAATLQDCTFESNGAAADGGGAYASGGVGVTFQTCRFLANTAAANGGGCVLNGSGTLDGCTLDSNGAVLSGGGAYSVGGGQLTNCTLTNNASQGYGGAVTMVGGVVAQTGSMRDCSLLFNSATLKGGGLFVDLNATVNVIRNVFANNSAAEGGAVHVQQGTASGLSGQFRNNLLHHNDRGFCIVAGSADVWNCTFVDNPFYGLKRIGNGATVDVMNSIFWENVDDFDNVPDGKITYSDIKDADGTDPTNIHKDPLFVNRTGENYRLRPSSPCIDGGFDYLLAGLDTDLDGKPRKVDADGGASVYDVDMGCYEYQP